MEGKKIFLEDSENQELETQNKFPEDMSFLKEFYEEIKSKIANEKIVISEITPHPYRARCKFKQGDSIACIDFIYDGKGQFKPPEPQPNIGNSNELLNKIISLITKAE